MLVPMRSLNYISMLSLRLCVIQSKTMKLSIINPQCCSSKNNKYFLFKQSNLIALPWKGEALFISNTSNSLLSNAVADTVAECAYRC